MIKSFFMLRSNIFYSILFGLAMEFQINIILKHSIGGMIGVLVLYALIGILTYYTFPFVMKRFKSRRMGFWTALVIHALAGLMIIEWGFMANTPTSIIEPILAIMAQLGMFAWWATIATMPYLIQQPEAEGLKKKILLYYALYALISTVLAILYGMAPVILIEPFVYLSFFYFYRRFACSL